jgi:protein KTI12
MALVTFSGYPASGKSTRAAQLKAQLDLILPSHLSVLVVSDESLNIPPSAYDGGLVSSLQISVVNDSQTAAQRNPPGAHYSPQYNA